MCVEGGPEPPKRKMRRYGTAGGGKVPEGLGCVESLGAAGRVDSLLVWPECARNAWTCAKPRCPEGWRVHGSVESLRSSVTGAEFRLARPACLTSAADRAATECARSRVARDSSVLVIPVPIRPPT